MPKLLDTLKKLILKSEIAPTRSGYVPDEALIQETINTIKKQHKTILDLRKTIDARMVSNAEERVELEKLGEELKQRRASIDGCEATIIAKQTDIFNGKAKVLKEDFDKQKKELKVKYDVLESSLNDKYYENINRQKQTLQIEYDTKLLEIKTELLKATTESDIQREKALAKLEVYEKLDNKDQINQMGVWLTSAIQGLSKSPIISVDTNGKKYKKE